MRGTFIIALGLMVMLAAPGGAAPRSVRLRWEASVTPGVVAYRVYARQVGESFGVPVDVGLPAPAGDGTLSATLPDFDDGVDWAFAVTAVGDGSVESSWSNEVILSAGGTPSSTTLTSTTSTTSTTVPQACAGDAECDDGSACTTDDRCASGFCARDPLVCPAGEPCRPGRCDTVAGCVVEAAPPGSPCDLGDPCQPGVCTETGCVAALARVAGHFLSVRRFVIRNGAHGPRLVARGSFALAGALDPTQSGFAFDVSAADGRVLWAATVPPEAFRRGERRGRRLRYRLARRIARTLVPDVRRLSLTVDDADAGVADVRLVAITEELARSRAEQSLRWAVRSGDQCVSDPGLVCEEETARTRCH
jgi:hypothetical protein